MKNGQYTLVSAPAEYPGKLYRGRYVYEHSLVWWQNTGSIPEAGYQIHHRNGDKTDNRFENLEKVHIQSSTKVNAPKAQPVSLECANCKKPFIRDRRNYMHKKKKGQINFFCCKPCASQYQFNSLEKVD